MPTGFEAPANTKNVALTPSLHLKIETNDHITFRLSWIFSWLLLRPSDGWNPPQPCDLYAAPSTLVTYNVALAFKK